MLVEPLGPNSSNFFHGLSVALRDVFRSRTRLHPQSELNCENCEKRVWYSMEFFHKVALLENSAVPGYKMLRVKVSIHNSKSSFIILSYIFFYRFYHHKESLLVSFVCYISLAVYFEFFLSSFYILSTLAFLNSFEQTCSFR